MNRDYLSSSIRYEEGEQGGKLMDEQGALQLSQGRVACTGHYATPLAAMSEQLLCCKQTAVHYGFGRRRSRCRADRDEHNSRQF